MVKETETARQNIGARVAVVRVSFEPYKDGDGETVSGSFEFRVVVDGFPVSAWLTPETAGRVANQAARTLQAETKPETKPETPTKPTSCNGGQAAKLVKPQPKTPSPAALASGGDLF